MYRLVPLLATIAMISLPACKRDRDDDTTDPDSGTYASSPTPTPEQVCGHLSDMAAADLGGIDPQIRAETIAMCTEQMSEEQRTRGPEGWDGVSRCVIAAQTDADIDRCDTLYPPGGGAAPTEPASATQEDQVCVIMISIFAIELMAEAEANGQPMPELADDDIREAHAECVTSLDAARQSRTGQQYDMLLDCLANADSSPGLDACLAN